MSGKRERARAILAESLGMPVEEVRDDFRRGSPASWDSLAHLRLTLAVEAERGRALEAEEILGFATLDDLEVLL